MTTEDKLTIPMSERRTLKIKKVVVGVVVGVVVAVGVGESVRVILRGRKHRYLRSWSGSRSRSESGSRSCCDE